MTLELKSSETDITYITYSSYGHYVMVETVGNWKMMDQLREPGIFTASRPTTTHPEARSYILNLNVNNS